MSLVQNMKVALALTNGGRALNAVWELRIPIEQKSILLYLGSQMDFRGDFTEYRWCPISLICHATCMSRSTVFRALSSLESEGYIVRKHRYRGAEQLASSYALAEKIFSEYAEKLSIPTCQADIPPHVTETPPPHVRLTYPPMSQRHPPHVRLTYELPPNSLMNSLKKSLLRKNRF